MVYVRHPHNVKVSLLGCKQFKAINKQVFIKKNALPKKAAIVVTPKAK